jgi:predicted amidophosphoribosyltransferase
VYALGRYAGPVRAALLAYKERGHRELAQPFGAAVAAGLRSIADRLPGGPGPPDAGWWLVPVPSRAAQARRRGGDHVARLAEAAAAGLAGSGTAAAVAPALRLSGGVRDSVGLDAAARAANLAGRVRPRRSGLPPAGTGVVLIDDVLTTGATVTESIAALRLAGLPPLAVIVLAVTERRVQSSVQGVLPAPFAKYLRRLSPTADVRKESSGS